ncbi:alpha/beta hydrolase-fold protein [Candidatus Izimaplasma bacterium]|nr:alpha/beta hydrolase-fold protein [Candidatus Izimaplasma bacterium]
MKKLILILVVMIGFIMTSCEPEVVNEEVKNPYKAENFLMPTEVAEDFSLIILFGGITINWESDNTDYIVIDQTGFALITNDENEQIVTLTASYVYKETEFSHTFVITVLAAEPENPLNDIIIEIPTSVTDDFVLPTSQDGASIEWESSNENFLVIDNGNVTIVRSNFDNNVILTATITLDDFTKVKYYNVLIEELQQANQNALIITFNITLPYPLEEDQNISMGSNLNSWDPANTEYFATKIDDLTYQLVLELTTIPDVIEYKWTVQDPDNSSVWTKVEKSEEGMEIGNRTATGSKGEIIVIDDIIGNFATDTGGPNSTVVGNLEIIANFVIPQIDIHDTTIRIWTPSTYNPDDETTKYPVIYMHDGQNCFDVATSYAGEWGIDETIEDFIARSIHTGAIVVGIDNSGAYRQNTYTPEWDGPGLGFDPEYLNQFPSNETYGERYAQFIVLTLKPYIDANYNTLTDRENTSIAGSSMGGLISFYVGLKYMDVFGSIGIFSPAFQVATETGRHTFIDSLDFTGDNLPKVYIDGGELEGDFTRFVEMIANELYDAGLPAANITTFIGENQGHNEPAWRARFPSAYIWFYNDDDGNFIPTEE